MIRETIDVTSHKLMIVKILKENGNRKTKFADLRKTTYNHYALDRALAELRLSGEVIRTKDYRRRHFYELASDRN